MDSRRFFRIIGWVILLAAMGFAQTANTYYLSFDGNDYLRYSDDSWLGMLDGATDYTIEAWIYPTADVATYDRVLQRYYSFNLVIWHIDAEKDSSDWYFTVWDDGGTAHYFNAKKSIAFNSWNHLAVINNSTAGSLTLYANGEEVSTQSYANMDLRPSHSSDNLYVGQLGNGSDFFNGFIDEVRMKNTAENPNDLNEDISQNYASDANTAILFHFDEGSGSMTQNSASTEGDSARLGGTETGDTAEPEWKSWNPSAIAGSEQQLPEALALYPNYPNPFNPVTTIVYTVTTQGSALVPVELAVYNILGEKVRSLVNETQGNGTYSVLFNAAGLPSGVYFTQLTAGAKHAVQKLILTK